MPFHIFTKYIKDYIKSYLFFYLKKQTRNKQKGQKIEIPGRDQTHLYLFRDDPLSRMSLFISNLCVTIGQYLVVGSGTA